MISHKTSSRSILSAYSLSSRLHVTAGNQANHTASWLRSDQISCTFCLLASREREREVERNKVNVIYNEGQRVFSSCWVDNLDLRSDRKTIETKLAKFISN